MLPLASLMVPLLQGHLGVSNDPLFLWQSLRLLAHGKHSAEIVVSCFIACLRLSAFRIASLRKRPASLGVAMEAKRLLEGAPFNPELAQACGEAFDQAWAVVALRKGTTGTNISDLRLQLAKAVLANAERCGTDVSALVKAALSVVLPKSEPQPSVSL
jgi:hypothetical protein